MAILGNTTIKGDLNVSEKLIENKTPIQDKFATKIEVSGKNILIKNEKGETLATVTLP